MRQVTSAQLNNANHKTPSEIADGVAKQLNASAHGVVLTIERTCEGTSYVIWTAAAAGVKSHKLLVDVTPVERLEAHVRGFIQNVAA